MDSAKHEFDVVTFTMQLECSAESFWKLLKRSKNFHVSLSSLEVICSITKFLLENNELFEICTNRSPNNELSQVCSTNCRPNNQVLNVSKKGVKFKKNERRHYTTSSSDVLTNVDIRKPKNEYFKQEARCRKISALDEVNIKAADIPDFSCRDISSASLGKQAAHIPDFTFSDINSATLGKQAANIPDFPCNDINSASLGKPASNIPDFSCSDINSASLGKQAADIPDFSCRNINSASLGKQAADIPDFSCHDINSASLGKQAADISDFSCRDINSASLEKDYKKSPNREKIYACSICQKAFLRPYLARKHLEIAHNKKEILQKGEQYIIVKFQALKEKLPFACSLCGKKFKEKRYLYNHYKFHVGQKKFACKICSREFLWLCHAKKHVKDVHNKDDVISNIDQYVKKLTALENEPISVSAKGSINKEQAASFSCNHCDQKFNQKRILKMHLLQKHSFGCVLPDIKTFSKESLKIQSRLSCKVQTLNEKTCDLLSAVTHANSVITSDEVTEDRIQDSCLEDQPAESPKSSFSCSYCEKCFTEKILAELHIFLTHEQDRLDTLTDENGHYICPICEKKIGAKRNFKAHLHIHVKERYFICTVCSKSFLWHSCATRHVKTHGFMDVNQYIKILTSDNHLSEKITCMEPSLKSQHEMKEQRDMSLETFCHEEDFNRKVGDNGTTIVGVVKAERVPNIVRGTPSCKVCTRCCRGFMTHAVWKEHMRTCSAQNQYKCLLCTMPFPTKCSAHRHLRRAHNKESDETDELVEEDSVESNHTALPNNPKGVAHSDCHFMCSVCKKFFRERRYLRQHMWTHRRQWMHRCKHCARYFTKKQFLQEHMINRHPLGNLQNGKCVLKNNLQDISDSHLCAVCGDSNADMTPEGHMCLQCRDKRAGGDIFTCGVCGIKMKNRHDLGVHSRTHEAREHKCDVCGKIYRQKKLLDIHQKEHSGEKPFCCETCELRFASSERLRFHNYNVHSERLRRNTIKFYASSLCPVCDIRIRIKDQMWNHLLIHSGTFELNCNYCDKFFTCTEELSVHGHSLHKNTDMPFSCFLCETRFSEKAKLLEHFRSHPEKQVHPCTQCSNTFYLKADLREHTKSKHERKKRNTVQEQALAGVYRGPFPCQMCGRVYQKKASLDIHMKIHYGIFDFPCDFCEKKFKSAAECRIHRRQHTKEKPYQCPYCGESFNRHSTLTQHKRRHTDERPYLCDDCGMAFRTRKTLQNHKTTHNKQAGVAQKPLRRVPPKLLPASKDIHISLPQHTEVPQQVPMMHQTDVSHCYSYWNMPRQ